MSSTAKYACPKCGEVEFVTPPNAWDRYDAIDEKLYWQKTQHADEKLELHCRGCGERAPAEFEAVAESQRYSIPYSTGIVIRSE